jgi:outer membrane protein assembly factor BamB
MLDKATPAQREPLEKKLAAEWAEIKDTKDLEKLGRVVDVFGPTISVGRLARLQLAERLMDQADNAKADELRQAQVLLLQLHGQRSADPQTAAQAVDALARLMLKKGQMSDAAFYYKQLGRDFAKITVKEGKTGADLYSELTTDKRFLPYLEEPRAAWHGNLKVTEMYGNFPIVPSFSLEPAGDVPPYYQSHRLALEQNQQQNQHFLKIVDQLTGQEVWRTPALSSVQYLQHGQPNIRTVYKVQGNVAVIHLGHMVYGIDAVDRKKLWEYNLYEPGTNRIPQIGQVMRDRDGNLQLLYQDGWQQKLGQPGAVEASYVCLQNRNGIVALDPIKGTAIWTKSDINSARTTVFGDDQYIYLVETNNEGAVATANRAVRAADGVTVQLPDFTKAYQHKIAQLGRTLLVKNETEKGVSLRLYDVVAGKDLWTKEFPANSIALKSELPELAGVIDPEGNVTAFDLRSRREVVLSRWGGPEKKARIPAVNKDHIDKLQDATILADRDQYYIVLNKTLDANVNNGVWMNVFHGMRCLTVNGMVYAFDRNSQEFKWYNAVANQMLVLEQFNDMPVLLFTARSNEWLQQGLNRINQHVVKIKSINKTNGKLLFDKQLNPNINNFHALVSDPKAGTIDLIGFNLKVRHTLEPKDTKTSSLGGASDTGVAVAQPAQPFAPPVPQPLPVGQIKLAPAKP